MRRFVKIKALFLVLLLTVATLSVLPSFAQIAKFELPTWITDTFTRQFKLGLDLQGGLHLEYSVAVDEALENKLDQMGGELESAFKDKKDVVVTTEREGKNALLVRFENPEDIKLATEDVMAVVAGYLERADDADLEAQGVIRMTVPDSVIEEAQKAVVGQAIDTVRRRVDAVGVAEPNIYPKNRQVVIELPGVSDTATELRAAANEAANQMMTLLTANGGVQVQGIENRDDPGAIDMRVPGQDARAVIEQTFGADKLIPQEDGSTLIFDDRLGEEVVILPPDPGAAPDPESVTISLTEGARDEVLDSSSDFRRLLKIIERAAVLEMHMVDDELLFRDTGKPYLRALFDAGFVTSGMGISVAIEDDYGKPEKGAPLVKGPVAFYALERETLERFFNSLPPEWRIPSTHKVAYGKQPWPVRRNEEPVQLWRTHIIRARADITGDRITTANVGYKADTGTPQVEVSFDKIGARDFDRMSGDNVGRKMAIIMDDMVVSDPLFNERIPNGNVVITLGSQAGDTLRQQANDLVKVLKSGSLPARLNKEFEIRVGADLGKDSVTRGFKAFLVGLGLVIVFMAIYYRVAGTIAVFALVMNMVLVLAFMALFGATLTLPGIAGIVLTIGMAVDANVIIFERVREFLREGFTARAAIEAGYDRAFTTILDSQLTTAIAGLVLWQYGSGPIRGFAITLLIGIATSIFTGVFATRVFFDWQANRRGFDRVSI
ncbi:Protein-export membrane protein SecD [Enhygromyxa salina]|uniref:Protein translocase subunit SecD n=1 Tax=Enhygromyxa salina TaxID=215803 RepID=A0A0C1ZKW7_9BACT|nr:protein translocase subunit SecD [Enhygromyxa salina]KIG18174.1 Protein-export membrane protein SecD [Enhygromyxa salina]